MGICNEYRIPIGQRHNSLVFGVYHMALARTTFLSSQTNLHTVFTRKTIFLNKLKNLIKECLVPWMYVSVSWTNRVEFQ